VKTLKSTTMGVLVLALVLAIASCASAPPMKSPLVNVTGDWVGKWTCDYVGDGNGLVVLALTQDGSRVTGSQLVTNTRFSRVSNIADGVVSADTVLTKTPDLSGSFAVSGDKMTGPFKTDVCQGKVDLTRESWTGSVNHSRLRTSILTVEAIDASNRWITLRGPSGGTLTMQVDERVQNLAQVAAGDTVAVAYYESWALTLDRPTESASASVRTTTGAGMPAVFAARRTNVKATVTSIDAGKPSVTLRGPRGAQEVSVADDPRVLAQLKVGETYDVTYTEHLAMIVEKTAKR
jgi:hypothetical protein